MDQLDLFSSENKKNDFEIKDGSYSFYPNFYKLSDANQLFNSLRNNIEWKQETMQMYGREVKFPRLTAWYGDNDKPYSFSGITLNPHPWNQDLQKIKNDIEPKSGVTFNSVLLNLYRDGSDSISWHTDAEKELGNNPVIASVNFGATRVFQLRHKYTKERIDIQLTHGSLLVMKGELQHFWQHQIPKSKKVLDSRINLTFRVII